MFFQNYKKYKWLRVRKVQMAKSTKSAKIKILTDRSHFITIVLLYSVLYKASVFIQIQYYISVGAGFSVKDYINTKTFANRKPKYYTLEYIDYF